jgi:hypothetical protein
MRWKLPAQSAGGGPAADRTSAPTASVSHVFQTPGIYAVDVRVRETAGLAASAHATVDVRLDPPPGNVGVSINNGNYATNNPRVQVDLIWPQFATQALVSNDGGFGAAGGTCVHG